MYADKKKTFAYNSGLKKYNQQRLSTEDTRLLNLAVIN